MILVEQNGDEYEVEESDCEVDGDGFWLLAAEGEEFEYFYDFVELDEDSEDEDSEDE